MREGESSETTVTLGSSTVQGLPAQAHERRAAASGPQATPAPTPNPALLSQQLAIATMRDEEGDIAREMIKVGRLIGIAAIATLPWIGGSQALRIAMAVSIVFALSIGVVMDRVLIQRGISERAMVLLAYTTAPSILTSVMYFGIYSAVQLFPTLSLYYFSRRERLASAFALFLTNAVVQATFATLYITGVLRDPGLVTPTLSPEVLAIAHALVQLGFLCAFLLGRGSYRATREALRKLETAVLAEARKDALFNEARQDLDRALAIDGPGRFTDRTFGAYRLGNLIGRGGMGDVYEAAHVETGEVAAVKLLAIREQDDPQSVERFAREIATAQRLASPHVVRVLAADARADVPYLVMERLHGKDLAHHLRSGRLAPAMLDEMLGQVGEAVEEAWALGIVHRDLKPQNIFLTEADRVRSWKILDFGVASLEDSGGTLTQGKIVGTPAYMAPEQAKGERVDHRADVYAIGAIAYRWLTGRPVVSGKDLNAALYQTVNVMPVCPSLLASLPPAVDAVLAIALVKDPALRWGSIHELRAALATAQRDELPDAIARRAATILERTPWSAS